MGNGLWQVFLAIGLTMWVDVARIVRGQVLQTRELPFVQATRALGLGQARVIVRHILPNIMGPVLVVMAATFAAAILLEAGLSFLGLGVASPTPSWGMMLSENRNYLVAGLPHLALLPGAAICLLVLSFFTVSNGLRDAFDVRTK
jgi:peptide/nickel transport system permease protein